MELITGLQPYHPALLALAVLSLVVLIQAVLTAPLAFISGEQAPGSPLNGDHNLRSFRVLRTHANSVENLAPFGFALLVAMIANANANVINWAAGAHVVFRVAFWAIYFAGVGAVAGGPRTLAFLGGLITNFVVVVAAIAALITGNLA